MLEKSFVLKLKLIQFVRFLAGQAIVYKARQRARVLSRSKLLKILLYNKMHETESVNYTLRYIYYDKLRPVSSF